MAVGPVAGSTAHNDGSTPIPHKTKLLGLICILLAALPAMTASASVPPYPDPPPDFAHPDDPHHPMFSPVGGQTDRPMLVVYAEFNDLKFEDTFSDTDATDMHNRFFGAYPSAAGYFEEVSNGQLVLTPAQESDDSNNGAVNDGIVSVSIDEDKSDFISQGREAAQAALLEAADPYVDYSQFDTDGNGRITQDELIFVRQDVDPDAVTEGSATARRPDPVTLDGVQLGSNNKDVFGTDDLVGVDAGTDTNLITLIHEIGHTAFDMPDTYFWDTARFDLGAGTSGFDDTVFFHNSAWQAMHLGWAEPTVVTQSGYYEVPRTPFGTSFILYDPDKGTDNFFVVENRARTPGTYESGAADTGLVIWQLDENEYHPGGGGNGFISLTRPDDGSAAWNPSLDPFDSEHTMEGVNWLDGTPADIATRAIPPASDVMRVYFDVRGPGVLVDPITHVSSGAPFIQDVSPGEANVIRVPVMNTGEAADDFRFYFDDLPTGWSSNADELALNAGEEGDAFPELVPASDAATGDHTITVVGESVADPSVRSEATLEVDVVLDITGIEYTGETYMPQGEPAGFEASVFNVSDGDAPVEGVEVTFELTGPGGSLAATGMTDATGAATADPIIDLPAGDYDLWVSTERFGKHAPGGTGADFHVPTAEERIADLQDTVLAADLHHGIEQSLIDQLDEALEYLEADDTASACGTLQAFSNHVSAQSGNHIPEATAESIIRDVEGIRTQIGC